MYSVLHLTFEIPTTSSAWKEKAPVQEELFGIERLVQHVQSLATTQPVTSRPQRVPSLRGRLDDNAEVLLAVYRASAAELRSGRGAVSAPGWLHDKHHLVEALVCEIWDDFPIGYYHRLPKLGNGPFAGYPRVFGLAGAFVAVAADVYSVAPHVGRGGWTWYTGAVGWVYRAGVEGDLGIPREGGLVDCRAKCSGRGARVRGDGKPEGLPLRSRVEVLSPDIGGEPRTALDGLALPNAEGAVHLPLDEGRHSLHILGDIRTGVP